MTKTIEKLIDIWSDITANEPYVANEDKEVIDDKYIAIKKIENYLRRK